MIHHSELKKHSYLIGVLINRIEILKNIKQGYMDRGVSQRVIAETQETINDLQDVLDGYAVAYHTLNDLKKKDAA